MGTRRYIQEIILFIAAVAIALAVVQNDAPELITALRDLPHHTVN